MRQILERDPPHVPPDLHERAVRRGRRTLRRRRLARHTLWVLLCGAVVAFTVYALVAHPWTEAPSDAPPSLNHW